MLSPNKTTFLLIWPKCFLIFLGVIEFIAVIAFILTELCSVAANFWTTNVFVGAWCGLIVLIHAIAIFVTALCSPGPPSAFRAAIITLITLIACAASISFNVAFIVRPTTCILTPSCATNAASSSIFSYSFRQSFFQVFNSWDPFKYYTESQVKLLCQAIQVGVAGLCFIICIIYLVIYFECLRRIKKHQQIEPSASPKPQDYNHLEENNYSPMPYGGQPNLQSPPPVTPGQVFMAPRPPPQQQVYGLAPPISQQVYGISPPAQQLYPAMPTNQVYVVAPPSQQVYMAQPPPPPQQVYYGPPQPQQVYYGPPPPAPPQPTYYKPLRFQQYAPPPYVSRAPPGAIPWNTGSRK